MATAASLIRDFLYWAEKEGRRDMLEAMAKANKKAKAEALLFEPLLRSHLSAVKSLNIRMGREYVDILVGYARKCKNAPIPPQAALDILQSKDPWPELKKELLVVN